MKHVRIEIQQRQLCLQYVFLTGRYSANLELYNLQFFRMNPTYRSQVISLPWPRMSANFCCTSLTVGTKFPSPFGALIFANFYSCLFLELLLLHVEDGSCNKRRLSIVSADELSLSK